MSIRFNLLPYRQERRALARRKFNASMAASAGLAIGLIAMAHMIVAGQVSTQDTKNELIKGELKVLDKRIEDIKSLQSEIEVLKAKKSVIEKLQMDRSAAVEILDQLTKLTPKGVYLNSLKQKGSAVTVTGYSISNDLIAQFMLDIGKSGDLVKPSLVEIKAEMMGPRRLSQFTLSFEHEKNSKLLVGDAKTVESKPIVIEKTKKSGG